MHCGILINMPYIYMFVEYCITIKLLKARTSFPLNFDHRSCFSPIYIAPIKDMYIYCSLFYFAPSNLIRASKN